MTENLKTSSILPPSVRQYFDVLLRQDQSTELTQCIGLEEIVKVQLITATETFEMTIQDLMESSVNII